MRIISRGRLREFWVVHPDARAELSAWYAVTDASDWKTPADVKRTFGARVDFVKVASGGTVAVFDIRGNRYRMIAAIHYDFPRVFVLRIMTHGEYDDNKWKDEL